MSADLAFFLHSFEMGGAQKRTLDLAAELSRRGRRVELLVARDEGPLRSVVDAGVGVTPLVAGPGAETPRTLALARAVPAVAAYLRRERPAVLMSAANHAILAAIAGHVLAGDTGTALVLRMSNPLTEGRYRSRDRLRSTLLHGLLSRVDGVGAVSGQIRDEIVALAPSIADRVRVIRNPAAPDPDALPPPRPREPGGSSILAVGRLAPQKGFDVLIRALAALPPPARLTVIGDGPERGALEALAAKLGLAQRIVFAGEAPDPLPAMAAADLFVLPSRFEGMPGALIEAMACGTPVVATDLPSVRDLLLDGALAPLVPPDDADALAAAMAAALANPPDTAQLRARAQHFSLAAAADDLAAVFEAAVARRRSLKGS